MRAKQARKEQRRADKKRAVKEWLQQCEEIIRARLTQDNGFSSVLEDYNFRLVLRKGWQPK